jgi:hypothetical protein
MPKIIQNIDISIKRGRMDLKNAPPGQLLMIFKATSNKLLAKLLKISYYSNKGWYT